MINNKQTNKKSYGEYFYYPEKVHESREMMSVKKIVDDEGVKLECFTVV